MFEKVRKRIMERVGIFPTVEWFNQFIILFIAGIGIIDSIFVGLFGFAYLIVPSNRELTITFGQVLQILIFMPIVSFIVAFIVTLSDLRPKGHIKEEFFFACLLIISAFFFFQEYFYIVIPNHKPFWVGGYPNGIPLTIIGIIGVGIYVIWYALRGRKLESSEEG